MTDSKKCFVWTWKKRIQRRLKQAFGLRKHLVGRHDRWELAAMQESARAARLLERSEIVRRWVHGPSPVTT